MTGSCPKHMVLGPCGAERAGITIPVIASVAVFTDEPSAAVLQ
jgi:hypothetical protein